MSTILFDDNALTAAANEGPALAQVYKSVIAALNAFAARPRPIANRVGGNDNSYELTAEPQIRFLWYPMAVGAPSLIGQALVVPIANSAAVPLTGLVLHHEDNGSQIFDQLVTQPKGGKEDINELPPIWYPMYSQPATLFANHASDYAGTPSLARQVIVRAGTNGTAYGPQVRSALIMERLIETKNLNGAAHPVVGKEAQPTDFIAPNSDIIGSGANYRDLASLRDFANRLFLEKSIHFSWNLNDDPGSTQGISVGSAVTCIIDQNIGASGTAPSVLGPGFKVPLRYTGHGLNQTVNCYPRVYARMPSGGTGKMWFYNRNNSGGMTAAFQPSPTVSITGSAWQWWPAGDFDARFDPYFPGNANPAYFTDNIVPCVAGTGGAIEVSAFTLRVCPS